MPELLHRYLGKAGRAGTPAFTPPGGFSSNTRTAFFFGLDARPQPGRLSTLLSGFLETDDKSPNYNTRDVPAQGRWYVCGMLFTRRCAEKSVFRKCEESAGHCVSIAEHVGGVLHHPGLQLIAFYRFVQRV